MLVGFVFVGGVGFGAITALTQPRKPEVATATSTERPTESKPEPRPETAPAPEPKTEPTKKAEPKPKKPAPLQPKPEPKKPDPPKPEPKKPEPPAAMAISYEKQVLPIFKAKCNLCHGDAQKKADVDLRTLASAVKGGSSGDGAVPAKPEKSSIWLAIDDGSMPPPGKEKLTDAEKKLVKDWILSGAK
jgi:outer membrane biosynthesis protein TonB